MKQGPVLAGGNIQVGRRLGPYLAYLGSLGSSALVPQEERG